MRAFLTGGTGFIGSHVARTLMDRGWDVVALVRFPERAVHLKEMGATLVGGDVTEPATLSSPMRRCDAVLHFAAWYAIGVTDRQKMYSTNVTGTQNVLEEAAAAGVERILHCSSVAALGAGEPGEVLDESRRHHGTFTSLYEETKWQSQRIVSDIAAAGFPVTTVMPGAVYGPGDTSLLSILLRSYARGWLVAMPKTDAAFSWVHVQDVAKGAVLALEKGRAGEEYIIGGENATVSDLFSILAPVTGIRPPRFRVPWALVKMSRPLGPLIARALHQEPRFLVEGLASLSGSWMASSDKAVRELGYSFRSIEDGMGETIAWFKGH